MCRSAAWFRSLMMALVLTAPFLALAQPFEITGGSDNTCQGAFLDSGGQGATGYDNDEDETYTLCPDAAGSLISVQFVTFQLSTAGSAPIDGLTIHDGSSTAAPVIGTYTGSSLQGQTVSATAANASGCLTFVWHSNETGTGVFAGSIYCYIPCNAPIAAAVMSESAPAKVCIGEAVSFNGSSSTTQAGFVITEWAWDFDDGSGSSSASPTTAHAFNIPGVYRVQLTVTDNNGCSSVNRLDLQVRVGTEPDFVGTTGSLSACVGGSLCLTGVVNPTPFVEVPGSTYGDGVYIPDDVGSCFQAELFLTQFSAGATLTSIDQLLGLCMNFEHTWLGDLVMTITSPSGQSVILHQQDVTGEVFMGQPIDDDEVNPIPGACETYCFANTSANGTMADAANSLGGGGGPNTLPPDTYQSLFPLSGLIGSQLNGLWTLTICDMWAQDNGFLCDWSLEFDPALYANLVSYTPQFGTNCDSTWWTGPGITSTQPGCNTICVEQPTAGTYNYVYHATDDIGCTFDTTVVLTFVPPIMVNAGPDQQLCAGAGTQLNGTVVSGGVSQTPFTYSWSPSTGLSNAGISNPTATPGQSINYTLTISQAGQPSCSGSDVVGLTIVPPPNAGSNSAATFCDNNGSASLFGLLGGTPVPGGTWTSPTGSAHSGTLAPSIDPQGVYTYTVQGQAPCAATAMSSVQVTIHPAPDAGNNATTTLCADGDALDLFDLLGGDPDATGTWTAPAGNVTNATYTPGSSTPGTYAYTVAGIAPCVNDQSTVLVVQHDPVDAGSDGSITLCSTAANIQLIDVLGGTPDPDGTWTNSEGTVVTGLFAPATNSSDMFTYHVDAIAPCIDRSASVEVLVSKPLAEVDILADVTCFGRCDGEALLTTQGGIGPVAVQWSSSVASVVDSTALDLCAGDHSVIIIDAIGCRDTVLFTITEPPLLVIDDMTVADELCPGTCDGEVIIADPEGLLFSSDGGATWSSESTLAPLCPGMYTVMMRDADGCEATREAEIGSPEPTVAEFMSTTDTVNVTHPMIAFYNWSGNATLFEWEVDGSTVSTESDPTITFQGVLGGQYEVCLTASNQNGCVDSTCRFVVVLDRLSVFVPNAFSPNGDGINEEFAPVLNIPVFADEYSFMVFDRWGELIHSNTTVGRTWDGNYNGTPVQLGVYVWKLHCKDLITSEEIDLLGHVSVIR